MNELKILEDLVRRNKAFSYMLGCDKREKQLENERTECNGTALEKLNALLSFSDLSILACGEDKIRIGGFKPSYKMSYDRLQDVSLYDTIESHEYGWIVKFIKNCLKEIEQNDSTTKASGRFINGVFVIQNNSSEKNLLCAFKKLFGVGSSEEDKLMIKLVKKIIKEEGDKKEFVWIEEEKLKEDLLSIPQDELDSLFAECDDEQIMDMFRIDNPTSAKRILTIARHICEEYNLADIIRKDEDWREDILENSWEEVEEEDHLMPALLDDLRRKEEKEKKEHIKDVRKKAVGNSSHNKTSIDLLNVETGETIHFDSKADCMEYLGVGKDTFYKFVKGLPTNIGKKFQIDNKGSHFS